jgi:sigma-54 specific flagellar transcriptional regulator A
MCRYGWPGNVRELANLVERLAILFPNGVVDVHDLPEKYRAADIVAANPAPLSAGTPGSPEEPQSSRLPRSGIDLKEHLTRIEADLITQALEEENWVVAHAAKRLQMGRTTLVEKMRKLGLNRHEEVSGL